MVELPETQQVSYLTQDHLGSPRVITNENGAVVSRRDFTGFGEESVTAQRTAGLGYDEPEIRKNYTGYEKDAESGLEFAQARYYNPTHGRFTSVDPLLESGEPVSPQTWNRYVYCLNNPLNLVDPDGQKWEFANEDLQKAFEEAVKAKGDKAWKAYQTIEKAKGTIKVGFGQIKENQFGDTNITGGKVDAKGNLTELNGTITISNDSKSLDVSNFTDLVSASAHEYTHVLSHLASNNVNGFVGLAPKDRLTQKERSEGKVHSFAVEHAAFDAQVNAANKSVANGNKPVSPDTALGRANKDFSEAKTPADKYALLAGYGYKFKETKPGAQPANQPSKTKKKP